jgi:radical SAM superfamily enzyme YgiQ (UPF0313 family)
MSGGPRIVLISPRGPLYKHGTGIWKRSLRYMPLTLTTLAALVPADVSAEVRLFDEGIDDIDLCLDADIIGISAITGSARRAYELADHFRGRGIPVVLGGPHPTLLPDEAALHADSVVVGYAEKTWPRLLGDFVRGRMQPRYVEEAPYDLSGIPVARRDLLPASQYVTHYTMEATRGCCHDCEFCIVPAAWKGFYVRPVNEVVEEIRSMNTRKVLFLDLNLISDVDHAKELFAALIPLKVTWGGLTTTKIAWDEELLDLIARSGCRGLLLGLESLQKDSLIETHKGFNAREDFGEVVRRLHKRDIAIMGCFAFGFDHDTPEVFERTARFAVDTGIDLPRFAIITPFPNTALHKRLEAEGRILTRDWDLYDAQHVVFEPAGMTAEQLLRGTEWTWKQVYGWSSIARRLVKSRNQLSLVLAANLGYRFYARNLHRYYTCGVSPV